MTLGNQMRQPDDDEARYFRRITLFFQAISSQIEDKQNLRISVDPSSQSLGRTPNTTDALNYLDAIKLQFSERPDIYNHFLDIMKDYFKDQLYVKCISRSWFRLHS